MSVAWFLRSQKTITLLVIESKYSAVTEVCCEILFIYVISLFMGVVVECPITVYVGNMGVIFLSGNTSVSQWKKHIDLCHHFIRDYIEDRTVKLQFFQLEESLVDPFTKT